MHPPHGVTDHVYVFGAKLVQTRATMKEPSRCLQAHCLSLQPEKCRWVAIMQVDAPAVMDLDGQQALWVQEMIVLGTMVSWRHAGVKAVQHQVRKAWESFFMNLPLLRHWRAAEAASIRWFHAVATSAAVCGGSRQYPSRRRSARAWMSFWHPGCASCCPSRGGRTRTG